MNPIGHGSNRVDRWLNPIDHGSNRADRWLNPIDHGSNRADHCQLPIVRESSYFAPRHETSREAAKQKSGAESRTPRRCRELRTRLPSAAHWDSTPYLVQYLSCCSCFSWFKLVCILFIHVSYIRCLVPPLWGLSFFVTSYPELTPRAISCRSYGAFLSPNAERRFSRFSI